MDLKIEAKVSKIAEKKDKKLKLTGLEELLVPFVLLLTNLVLFLRDQMIN